jgi:phage terminase Nu1 subunit (DNA packaging protein)
VRIKATSLRLSEDLAAEIAAVARAEGVPVSEAFRAALHQYIATRRADPGFQERLQKRLEEDREALEHLERWRVGGPQGT